MASRGSKKRYYSNSDEEKDERDESPVASLGIDLVKFHALMQKLQDANLKASTYPTLTKEITKLIELNPDYSDFSEIVKDPEFSNNLKMLIHESLKIKNMDIGMLAKSVSAFISDGSTVKYYEGYPKIPRRAMDYYIASRKKDGDGLRELGVYRKEYTQLPENATAKFKKLGDQDRERCFEELTEFLERNRERLLDSHINFLNKRLATLSNTEQPDSTPNKKRRVAPKKKSAFDLYVAAYEQDYADMDEEKKLRKLQRRFEKLEDAERQVFERIAQKS
uniref:Uncharacterized protein n=1 Tax=Panagrolaimus sp. JU765 TaxID=591449 RepID=A0AC34QPD5_9BILA